MSKVHTLTYLQNQNIFTYNILDSLSVTVQVHENPYDLPLDFLFGMAARKNKKRGFLFVSKILGKHIPIAPVTSLLSGAILGIRYIEEVHQSTVANLNEAVTAMLSGEGEVPVYQSLISQPFKLPEETLFIGFAETATSLGHSVFDLFENAHYIHTTREKIAGLESIIDFEEEHSHATEQACYGNEELLKKSGPIVLVDDEITTGKTALNIIESIHSKYPRKEYVVISLLDWRSKHDKQSYQNLEKKLGITIKTATLLAGEIAVDGDPVETEGFYEYPQTGEPVETVVSRVSLAEYEDFKRIPDFNYSSIDGQGNLINVPYSGMTGRFEGLSEPNKKDIDYFAQHVGTGLKHARSEGKALCLGTGEFMYLPMKIASYMGEDVSYQSTTRSPIHRVAVEGYAVTSGCEFESPDDALITNYFYNIKYKQYEDIFLFLEREVEEIRLTPILEKLKQVGATNLFVVTLNEHKKGEYYAG